MDQVSQISEALNNASGINLNSGLATAITLCLNGVGAFLKSDKTFQNKYIPYVMVAIGTVLYPLLSESFRPSSFGVGIFLGLGAVGVHQSAKTVIRSIHGDKTPTAVIDDKVVPEKPSVVDPANPPKP